MSHWVTCSYPFFLVFPGVGLGSTSSSWTVSPEFPCTAARYRAALEIHFQVLEQCTAFDPVKCARLMRSKRHMNTAAVKIIEEAKRNESQAEASAQLVTYLSELSDAGMCYFVNHYLTENGLEQVSSTIRHCPGPDRCTLNADECHADAATAAPRGKSTMKISFRDFPGYELYPIERTIFPSCEAISTILF